MGATQSRATVRVFFITNHDHTVHYWNYPNMPAGWSWYSAGVADYEVMNITEDEAATVEECFEGSPANIEEMRAYLRSVYDALVQNEVIDEYTITEKVVEGKSFIGRILEALRVA
jgi:hypothetical protein